MRRSVLVLAFLAVTQPAWAVDFQPLRVDPEISTGLRWIAAADAIRNTCPSIEERTFRALSTATGLLNRARALGYSFSEAKAYVDDGTEQARVKAEAMAYLRQAGAVDGNAESFCTVGRAEIARGSAIGVLIREN
jgi:hypothetical protein